MKIKVDQDKCIGCGLCTNLCPKHFAMQANGKSKATTQPKGEAEEKCCQEAIASCPVEAISKE